MLNSNFPQSRVLSKFAAARSGLVNFPKCMVRRLNAREKFSERKSASMYPAFGWRFVLLALMRYAACLSLETPRPFEAQLENRFQARRCDCSFIFTRPVQTLGGELVVGRG